MIISRPHTNQGDADEKDGIGPSVRRLNKDVASFPPGHREDSEGSHHGETGIGHHVVEIRDTQKRAGVGKQVVVGVLGDGIQRQETDEADYYQTDQD